MTIVVSPLGLFQESHKVFIRTTIELCKPPFAKTPKAFNTIHMALAARKLVVGMEHSVMVVTIHYQSVIRLSAVGMYRAAVKDFSLNYRHQLFFRTVRNNLYKDLVVAF